MLSNSYRFHGRGSLKYVHQNGKTVRGALLSLKYAPNQQRASFRCAVIVSRKVHGSAVVRNRIRRRIYEVVRQEADKLGAYDLVFIVFSDQLATIPADQLQKMVKDCLARAQLTNSLNSRPNQRDIIKHKES
jgi:ribonuclease P protein component